MSERFTQGRSLRGLSGRDLLVTAGIALPALTWTFANFGLTLVLGHPTANTKEVPYFEVALQGLLAIAVFSTLPRQWRLWWLAVLVPLPTWTLLRAVTTNTSPVWAVLFSTLLMSPILSVLMAGQTTDRALRLLRVAFVAIMAAQLLTFPLNLVGLLSDENINALDRFSGTLLGRGGYLSSYVLLAGGFFLGVTRVRPWLKAVFFAVVMAYAWVAEAKMIPLVAGVVLGVMLLFSCTRQSLSWKIPAAALSVVVGMWLSLTLPSSYGLQVHTFGYSINSLERSIGQLDDLVETTSDDLVETTSDDLVETTSDDLVETTSDDLVETTSEQPNGSKIAATIATLWPTSDLWRQSSGTALFGVGPSGGLSHIGRIADDSGLFANASRPDAVFREAARAQAGSQQDNGSLTTQPESTVNGLVSEVGYVGLVLFCLSFFMTVQLSLRLFTRTAVGIFVGLTVAFVPFFNLWEISGLWMVVALGLASIGTTRRPNPLPHIATISPLN